MENQNPVSAVRVSRRRLMKAGVAASAACNRNREYGCQQQGKRSDVFFHKRCLTVSPPCPNPTALRRRRMYRSYRPKAMQTP